MEKICYNIEFYLKGNKVADYGNVFGTDLTDALKNLGETLRERREPRIEYDEIKARFNQMMMLNGENKNLDWFTQKI